MIKAVIFDIDGTLVDSVGLHAEAWREVFLEFGKDIPFETVRLQIGKGGDQLLPVFFSEEELKKIEERRSEIFKEKYMPKVAGFPGVPELFQRILKDGKQVALASSAKATELETYKEKAGITDLVQTETSSDDAEKSKPHPDIFQAALDRLKDVKPEEALVVGDTPYDIEAASKAGIRTIAVRCGGFPEHTLRGAIAIFNSPADLLEHYEESPLVQ